MSSRSAAVILAFTAGLVGAFAFGRGWFAAGGSLVLASVAILRWATPFWSAPEPPELSATQRWLGLTAVLAIALFFRSYHLVPPGLWGDDAINGLLALQILDGEIKSPFQLVSHSQSRFHALSNYPMAAAFRLFGAGLATLRLPGSLLGFLCVPLVYATFGPLFRARVALCAALFFATSALQISQGKILIQGVTGEFLELLGMCLLVRGATGQRRWLITLAGIPLGLMLCTYHSFKVAPLGATLFAALLLWQCRGDERRTLALWFGGGFAILILAAAPGMTAYVREPLGLTGRIGGASLLETLRTEGSVWPLWDSLWRTLAIFHYEQGPRTYHWFGIGTDPALDVVVGILVLHGVLESILRRREPRHFLLLAWFAVGLIPGVLSSEAPRAYRILPATVPVFLWAALPVERLLAWAKAERDRAAGVVAALILLAVPLIDFNYYFYRVYTHPGYEWMQGGRMVALASALRARGDGWIGYLLSGNYDTEHESLRFLRRVWGLDMRPVASLSDVLPLRREENALFLFDPAALDIAAAFESFYPGTGADVVWRPEVRQSWFDPLLPPSRFTPRAQGGTLALSKSAAASFRGLRAYELDAAGVPVRGEVWRELALRFDPGAMRKTMRPTRILALGSLYAPASGGYRFARRGDMKASLRLDGHPLLTPEQPESYLELTQGMHTLDVSVDTVQGTSFDVVWQVPGESEFASIAPVLLYRDDSAHGWLAEYESDTRRMVRLEPTPAHEFFPLSFGDRYKVHWQGRLVVPPGGRFLALHTRGSQNFAIDGEPWQRTRWLEAGVHDVDFRLEGVEGPLLVDLQWYQRNGETTPVGLDAFLPPG